MHLAYRPFLTLPSSPTTSAPSLAALLAPLSPPSSIQLTAPPYSVLKSCLSFSAPILLSRHVPPLPVLHQRISSLPSLLLTPPPPTTPPLVLIFILPFVSYPSSPPPRSSPLAPPLPQHPSLYSTPPPSPHPMPSALTPPSFLLHLLYTPPPTRPPFLSAPPAPPPSSITLHQPPRPPPYSPPRHPL